MPILEAKLKGYHCDHCGADWLPRDQQPDRKLPICCRHCKSPNWGDNIFYFTRKVTKCLRCNYIWLYRLEKIPKSCPKCNSKYWDRQHIRNVKEIKQCGCVTATRYSKHPSVYCSVHEQVYAFLQDDNLDHLKQVLTITKNGWYEKKIHLEEAEHRDRQRHGLIVFKTPIFDRRCYACDINKTIQWFGNGDTELFLCRPCYEHIIVYEQYRWMVENGHVEMRYCKCGCGEKIPLKTHSNRNRLYVKHHYWRDKYKSVYM